MTIIFQLYETTSDLSSDKFSFLSFAHYQNIYKKLTRGLKNIFKVILFRK